MIKYNDVSFFLPKIECKDTNKSLNERQLIFFLFQKKQKWA